MIQFGMNSAEASAANAAMSGSTYSGYHILIVSLIGFMTAAFVLAGLISAYNHFAEQDLSLDHFIKAIVLLAVFFIFVGIFLVI